MSAEAPRGNYIPRNTMTSSDAARKGRSLAEPVTTPDDLLAVFQENEKPASEWRVGTEAEKFGVDADFKPISYDGPTGVMAVLQQFEKRYGWQAVREAPGGPVIAYKRAGASLTLEPAAQFELSGAPFFTVHETFAEVTEHLAEVAEISAELGLRWLGTGFHPFATHEQLPWVPKRRYRVMKEYLPAQGSRGLDMMRRTATVQANFDYASEEDAMRKLRVCLRLSILTQGIFANAPFFEGRVSHRKSERVDVWQHMDPKRSGRIYDLWDKPRPTYQDYVEWALDAGMFLFARDGELHLNTGQTFRSFMRDGYHGLFPTQEDWRTHLNSLFPEVRLKNTLEVRSADCVPRDLMCALPALFTGLLYDATALSQAEELCTRFTPQDVQNAERNVATQALQTVLAGRPLRTWAEELLEIAQSGLSRRGKLRDGRDESVYLAPLRTLVEAGLVPADRALHGLVSGDAVAADVLAQRCAV